MNETVSGVQPDEGVKLNLARGVCFTITGKGNWKVSLHPDAFEVINVTVKLPTVLYVCDGLA